MSDSDDLRAFIREITLRFERGMDRVAARMDENIRLTREENRVYFERILAEHEHNHQEARERLDELLAEGRAGRQALFHLLDELRGGRGGAAPAA
jgi:uncharacterized protein YoaH (UPF0181 family)